MAVFGCKTVCPTPFFYSIVIFGMKKPISVSEALKIIDASSTPPHPRPISIIFCTADKRRDTGGERIYFDRAVLNAARQEAAVKGKGKKPVSREKRYPINIKNLTSREIRKVNIDLIETINGHPVL